MRALGELKTIFVGYDDLTGKLPGCVKPLKPGYCVVTS